jgi:hypothetical protein
VGVRQDTCAYQVQRHAAHKEHLGNQSHSASSRVSRWEQRLQARQLAAITATLWTIILPLLAASPVVLALVRALR